MLKITKKTLSLAILSLVTVYGEALSDQSPNKPQKPAFSGEPLPVQLPKRPKKLSNSIGGGVFYENLSYILPDQRLEKEDVLGIDLAWESLKLRENGVYAKIETVAKWGLSNKTKLLASSNWISAEGKLGVSCAYGLDGKAFAIFFGVGHYMQAISIPDKNNDLVYRGWYMPIGLSINHAINKNNTIKIDASWLPQVYSSLTTNNKWVRSTTTKKNCLFEFSWQYLFSNMVSIKATPFLGHWEDSNNRMDEKPAPRSVCNFFGIKVCALYNF
jgi:hypothetical protein